METYTRPAANASCWLAPDNTRVYNAHNDPVELQTLASLVIAIHFGVRFNTETN